MPGRHDRGGWYNRSQSPVAYETASLREDRNFSMVTRRSYGRFRTVDRDMGVGLLLQKLIDADDIPAGPVQAPYAGRI